MRLKKLIATTLIIATIASTNTTLAFADTTTVDTTTTTTEVTATPAPSVAPAPKTFTDIKKGKKYYTAVTKLAKKGAIGGYKDGSFKPKVKITNSKFISILMRSMYKNLPRATAGQDYDATVVKVAFKKGIIKPSELSPDDFNKSLTRGNMALWLTRTIEVYTGNDCLAHLNDVENLISDYSSIPSKYQDEVLELYSEGIVTSKSFKYSGKVTRGTAVTYILKAVTPKYRKDMSKVKIPDEKPATRESITIKWSDKSKTKLPHAGDTFIDKNGKKTKLTSFWWKGHEIVGVEQGVQDLYGNYAYPDGAVVKEGEFGIDWDSPNYEYLGSEYVIDDKTGIGLWSVTWKCVADYYMTKAQKVKNPKKGDTYGPYDWCVYTDAFGGGWEWTGPAY